MWDLEYILRAWPVLVEGGRDDGVYHPGTAIAPRDNLPSVGVASSHNH